MSRPDDGEIAAALMALAHERGRDKTFCPSEAARRLSDDWRPLMPEIRRVAGTLPLVATRAGREIPATEPGGPIRLTLR